MPLRVSHRAQFSKKFILILVIGVPANSLFAQQSQSNPSNDPWRATITNPAHAQTSEPGPLSLAENDAMAPDEGDGTETSGVASEQSSTSTMEPEPLLWKGFVYGDPHFRDKPRPVGSPLYFEDPFINSDARLVYLYHKFPKDSALKGGDLNVYALQLRLALTDRLQFLATCDGYSHLESPILDDDSGWNDLALGAKYALYVDHENDFLVSGGLKWRLSNGHAKTLHGNVDELTPFISMYKGWGKWNFIADVAGRIAMDEHRGNHLLSYNLSTSYEILDNLFFPLFEFHGVHYLSNGDRLPLDIGGLDYANIGSNDVAGHAAFWGGIGARWNIVEHVSWGAVWEFPMQTTTNNDIFDYRVTTNLIFTF